MKAWLDEQAPTSAAYQALAEGLCLLPQDPGRRGLAGSLDDDDAGGAAPAARLRGTSQLAALPPNAPADAGADVAAALQRYQEANGLPTSGKLDAATVEQLNVPAQTRAAQIRASLERLRWLPRQQPATRST